MRTINQIGIDRELLKKIAPEQPIQQDEQGGCVWCGEDSWGSESYRDYERHEDCPWGRVRKIICESAESTVDADGLVAPLEFRDYIRSRRYGVEADYDSENHAYVTYGFKVNAPKRRTLIDSHPAPAHGDEVLRPLLLAKNWCDQKDGKPPSNAGSVA
jgi:hypothetical protein